MSHRLFLILTGTIFLVVLASSACGPDTETSTWSEELKVCAAGATVKGIDVSVYQRGIDWNQVAGAGYVFAIARINDGHSMDPYFAGNWDGIKKAGLVRGAYQFYEPTLDPGWQADVVINAVGPLGDGDLGVTLDVEWPSLGGTPNAQAIRTWVDKVAAGTGKTPMIYTALGYWNQYLSDQFNTLPLWAANWDVSCPNLASGWDNWFFWQTADHGAVPGIAGNVDQDVFNGNVGALHTFANYNNANGCTPKQIQDCGNYGCACADAQCGGAFCPGTGCNANTTNACGAFGCNCVDGKCSGGFCPDSGCTAKETNDCSKFGCQCVDHQCSGGFCPGQGCTAKEGTDCSKKGCGCVDHQCNGGSCAGTGCTAKQATDCQKAGQSCLSGKCTTPSDGGSPDGGEQDHDAGTDAGSPDGAGTDGGAQSDQTDTGGPGDAGSPGDAKGPGDAEQAGVPDTGTSTTATAGSKIEGGCSCGTSTGELPMIGLLPLPLGLLRRRIPQEIRPSFKP